MGARKGRTGRSSGGVGRPGSRHQCKLTLAPGQARAGAVRGKRRGAAPRERPDRVCRDEEAAAWRAGGKALSRGRKKPEENVAHRRVFKVHGGLNVASSGASQQVETMHPAAPERKRRFVPEVRSPHSLQDRHRRSGTRCDGRARNLLPALDAALPPTGSAALAPYPSWLREARRSGSGRGPSAELFRSREPDSAAGFVANCHWTGVGGRLSSKSCFRCTGDGLARPGHAMRPRRARSDW